MGTEKWVQTLIKKPKEKQQVKKSNIEINNIKKKTHNAITNFETKLNINSELGINPR